MVNPSGSDNGTGAWTIWSSSTSNSATGTTWGNWASSGTSVANTYYNPPELTDAERQRREENIIRYQEESKKKAEEQAKAENIAEELLLDHLNKTQKQEWKSNKYFEMVSPTNRKLRLLPKRTSNIEEYDLNGKRIGIYCIHPSSTDIPINDQLLMQKMMIENHEEEFFKIAIKRG